MNVWAHLQTREQARRHRGQLTVPTVTCSNGKEIKFLGTDFCDSIINQQISPPLVLPVETWQDSYLNPPNPACPYGPELKSFPHPFKSFIRYKETFFFLLSYQVIFLSSFHKNVQNAICSLAAMRLKRSFVTLEKTGSEQMEIWTYTVRQQETPSLKDDDMGWSKVQTIDWTCMNIFQLPSPRSRMI